MDNSKIILVTGGGGFLGAVLVPMLLQRGYRVRVLDRFFFGKDALENVSRDPGCVIIEDDVRWYDKKVFQGIYAVLDLAALANDLAGELDPERTMHINFRARVRTAALAKDAGVERYILASSCSVYGFQNELLDETAPVSPITTYAKACVLAENGTLALDGDNFFVTALRQGTLYGLSPRMRFDLVINTMTLSLFKDGFLTVRGGTQWRPLVHVIDSARAFVAVLEADSDNIGGQIFNVGSRDHNFRIQDLADKVVYSCGKGHTVQDKSELDTRSYRVNCDKILRTLNFSLTKNPEDGAKEIFEALKTKKIIDYPQTRTVDWYKKLLADDPTILDREFIGDTHKYARSY